MYIILQRFFFSTIATQHALIIKIVSSLESLSLSLSVFAFDPTEQKYLHPRIVCVYQAVSGIIILSADTIIARLFNYLLLT